MGGLRCSYQRTSSSPVKPLVCFGSRPVWSAGPFFYIDVFLNGSNSSMFPPNFLTCFISAFPFKYSILEHDTKVFGYSKLLCVNVPGALWSPPDRVNTVRGLINHGSSPIWLVDQFSKQQDTIHEMFSQSLLGLSDGSLIDGRCSSCPPRPSRANKICRCATLACQT